VLGRAFYNDPQWTALVPDPAIRRERLPIMFVGAAKMTHASGGSPERTAGFEAVALWLRPGRDIGARAIISSAGTSARWLLTPPVQNIRRLTRVMRQFDKKRKQLMREPHWYLMAIGVDPDHQGEGHGSALVRAGIRRADRDSNMIYLETETEQTVAFYERLGFEVLDELTIAEIGIPFSLMVRHPGAAEK
jgi:RimJ/RimL family protein N-acetyltransferase